MKDGINFIIQRRGYGKTNYELNKDIKEWKEKYIRLHNIYIITKKKNKLLLEERERHNKLFEEQKERIKLLEKRIKEYEGNRNSR